MVALPVPVLPSPKSQAYESVSPAESVAPTKNETVPPGLMALGVAVGCVVIIGGPLTVSVAAVLVALPLALLMTTSSKGCRCRRLRWAAWCRSGSSRRDDGSVPRATGMHKWQCRAR